MSDVREQSMISFEEASVLLNVPCSTLTRWIRQGKIPCRKLARKFIFSRTELCAWAQEHDIPLLDSSNKPQEKVIHRFNDLVDSLARGGAHEISADTIEELFTKILNKTAVSPQGDPTELLNALLERESMAPTAMGRGIAFPHPRFPERFHFSKPLVGLFYVDPPISFDAPDNEPVGLVFALFTPDTRSHLRLMSLLSQLLRQGETIQFLKQKPGISELQDWLRSRE